jgi:hypothetical protein
MAAHFHHSDLARRKVSPPNRLRRTDVVGIFPNDDAIYPWSVPS